MRRHYPFRCRPLIYAAPGNAFPDQSVSGKVFMMPGTGGAGATSFGGSGRNTTPGNSVVFFIDDNDGTTVVNNLYSTYSRVRHGTVRGFAAVTGPKMGFFLIPGVIDLGGSDLRIGDYADLSAAYAPGGVILSNGIVTTVKTFGSPAAIHQRYTGFSCSPGDPAGVDGSNRDGFQIAGGDENGANASNFIYLKNMGIHHFEDEGTDGYYGNPSGEIGFDSCDISRGFHKAQNVKTLVGDVIGATSANPIVITSLVPHQKVTGHTANFSGMPGSFAALNGNTYSVTVLSSTTFSIAVNGTGFGAYTSGGGFFGSAYAMHGYGPIIGDGFRWKSVSYQGCIFGHLGARMPMICADEVNVVNCLFVNPGDVEGNSAQCVRLTNDYDAIPPGTTPVKANIVGNVFIKGVDSATTIDAITVDPNGTDTTTRLNTGSQGFVDHNAAVGFTYGSQSAMKTGTYPTGFTQSSLITSIWPFGDSPSVNQIALANPTSQNPNAYTGSELRALVMKILNAVGPMASSRDSSVITKKTVDETIAMFDNTAGKGQCVNSLTGTSNASSWPNPSLRFAPNDGGLPSASGSASIASLLGSIYFPLFSGEPDDRVATSGTLPNGRPKAGLTFIECGHAQKLLELGAR